MESTVSNNPLIRRLPVDEALTDTRPMTVAGTIRKTGLLLGIVTAVTAWTWWSMATKLFPVELASPVMLGSVLVGFGLAIGVAFRPHIAAWAGPLYAVCQGLALGLISAIINAKYAGLPMMAVGLTIGTSAAMLGAYRFRLVRVGERFRAIVVGLTMGVGIFYLFALGLQFFGGITIPFMVEGGALGIGFSLFVTALAAFNLLLDFDAIERGVAAQAPKYLEWALATGITITLVWLYLEILRLLGKLRR